MQLLARLLKHLLVSVCTALQPLELEALIYDQLTPFYIHVVMY